MTSTGHGPGVDLGVKCGEILCTSALQVSLLPHADGGQAGAGIERMKWMEERKHTISDRGFKFCEGFTDLSDQRIYVSESSLATEPAIRIYVGQEAAHLTLKQAEKIARDLLWLCTSHYQVQTTDG